MSGAFTVSVVTPVYNGARYLAECIESVLRQTYRDWEYVVVDNCSTDDTAAIVQGYAARDARIRHVRCDEFVGVLANHNRAARALDPGSQFVKFVHADDWLTPECLERMVAVAKQHPEVGVVSAYRLEGAQVMHAGLLPYTQTVMPGREVVRRALLGPPWVTGSPTSLLFRADLVRGVASFLDEAVWHSDTDAAFRALMQSDLGFVHQVLTFTRLHPGALTSFSHRVNTYIPHDLRMTVRYGRTVLAPAEYGATLSHWLKAYLWFLCRQAVKPSRFGDEQFHDFHRREVAYLLREVGDDRRTAFVLRLCLRLLRAPGRAGTARGGLEGSGSELALSRYGHIKGADAAPRNED